MTDYAYFDIGLTILIVLFAVRGFTRGFIREFFSLGAPALGIFVSFLFYKTGAEFIRTKYFADVKGLAEVLAFIVIFLIVFIICKLIQRMLSDVIKGMKLDSLDKLLGAAFGFLEGIVAVALVLFVISIQPIFDPSAVLQGSLYGRIILPLITETSREGLKLIPYTAALRGLYSPG